MFRGIGGATGGGEFCDEGGDLPKIERTRWMVFLLEGAVLDGVAGGLRRKSVRISVVGCGSDIFPKEEPERRFRNFARCRLITMQV